MVLAFSMSTFGKTISIAAFCIAATSLHAETIARCGVSKGYSYLPAIGLYPKETGVFNEGGYSNGSVSLNRLADGTFDLLFRGDIGDESSSITQGAKVFEMSHDDKTITIVVVLSGISEVYTFMNTRSGPEVMWTTSEYGTTIFKVGAYNAKCTYLSLPN